MRAQGAAPGAVLRRHPGSDETDAGNGGSITAAAAVATPAITTTASTAAPAEPATLNAGPRPAREILAAIWHPLLTRWVPAAGRPQ
jgi:hypothetical protein